MTRRLAARALGTTLALLLALAIGPAAAHPMDPLTADEIIQAASILLDGGAAQPGTIFQAIDLREPARSEVVGLAPGDGLPRRAPFEVAP